MVLLCLGEKKTELHSHIVEGNAVKHHQQEVFTNVFLNPLPGLWNFSTVLCVCQFDGEDACLFKGVVCFTRLWENKTELNRKQAKSGYKIRGLYLSL